MKVLNRRKCASGEHLGCEFRSGAGGLEKGVRGLGVGKGAKALLGQLRADEREKAAKEAVRLFVQEFVGELEDKTPLSSAVPGYRDQLKRAALRSLKTYISLPRLPVVQVTVL